MTVSATASDHEEVSAAIAAAEVLTDGEILTILAPCSDTYRDVALHYCVLAMLAAPALLALLPQGWVDWITALLLGWNGQWTRGGLLLALLVAQALAFLLVRLILTHPPLLMALTPGPTKSRRARRRAVAHFRASLERRTRGRTGILIYLSLQERRAEIVADQAINDKVDGAVWGEAMALLLDEVRQGRTGRGLALAVEKVGGVLAEHLPRSADDTNEIPDRLIEL